MGSDHQEGFPRRVPMSAYWGGDAECTLDVTLLADTS